MGLGHKNDEISSEMLRNRTFISTSLVSKVQPGSAAQQAWGLRTSSVPLGVGKTNGSEAHAMSASAPEPTSVLASPVQSIKVLASP